MKAKGRSDTVYKPVPPDAMFPTDAEWNAGCRRTGCCACRS